MILNSKSVTINDFSPPVRLTVDEHVSSEEEDAAPKAAAASRASKRKTRIVNQEYSADDGLAPEKPLLLEDYDCQHSFIGKSECGQDGRYVFLVNQVRLLRCFRETSLEFCPSLNGSSSTQSCSE